MFNSLATNRRGGEVNEKHPIPTDSQCQFSTHFYAGLSKMFPARTIYYSIYEL